MKELQAEFMNKKDLRLVLITVDPERDILKVLSESASRFGENVDANLRALRRARGPA